MRGSNFDGVNKIGSAFELPEASAARRTNAHKLTTLVIVLLRECLATAVLSKHYKIDPRT